MITKFKIFESFDEDKIKVGDILKRKSISDKHYDLSLITYIKDNYSKFSNDIVIYDFAMTSLDFKNIKFKYQDRRFASTVLLNKWHINEYSLLDEHELQLLCDKIYLAEDYYFERIEEITNINLKEFALSKISNKYNL